MKFIEQVPVNIIFTVIISMLLITGCVPDSATGIMPTLDHPASTLTAIPEPEERLIETVISPDKAADYFLALTYSSPDGNRLVEGRGGLSMESMDIELDGIPRWVIAAQFDGKSIWYAVPESGKVQAFEINGKQILEIKPDIAFLPPGMPPVLVLKENRLSLLPFPPDSSPLTHPVQLKDGTEAYIDSSGQLQLNFLQEGSLPPFDVLPDARILSDQDDRLMVLSGPTTSYPHGVLGDAVEATTITLLDTRSQPVSVNEIQIADGDVIEGIAPLWVDLDHDGQWEVIVTQSNPANGSRIVVYREDGSMLAQGDPIGQGFRWYHLIAAAQFIEGGPLEIAAVRTPHIGGVVEIFSLEGDRLIIQGSLGGYSSHQMGSRNMDSAFAGDTNGDGLIELIVPDQTQSSLAAIQFNAGELTALWTVPLGGKLSTNLTAVNPDNNIFMFGAGTQNQTLRIWITK